MDRLDTLLRLLANPTGRAVVCQVDGLAGQSITLEELSSQVAEGLDDRDSETVLHQLHHNHLPKLQELGFVEYDYRSATVQVEEPPSIVEDLCTVVEAHYDAGGNSSKDRD